MTFLCVLCVKCWNAVVGSGWVFAGWFQCRRMPQIPGYYGKRKAICFANVGVYWSHGLPFFVLLPVSSHFPDFCPHVFLRLFCFAPKRHTYAQFVLWWLQARTVCEAFIWSCDQVGVLLCQHRVRLWRALPTLPTTELWYRYSNHSTLYTHTEPPPADWHTHTQLNRV